jgi:hypothetical protein
VAAGDIANMKYAKCTLPQTGILPYFMQAVGFGPQTVTSHAVASLAAGITNCGLPIAICQNKTPPATCPDGISAPDAMGLCKKEWYCSKFTAGNSEDCSGSGLTGSFNWIDYPPNPADCRSRAHNGQGNASEFEPSRPDRLISPEKSWNTRFGSKGWLRGTDASGPPPRPPGPRSMAHTNTTGPTTPPPGAGARQSFGHKKIWHLAGRRMAGYQYSFPPNWPHRGVTEGLLWCRCRL